MTETPTPSRTGWCSAGQHRLCRRPFTCGCGCDPVTHGADARVLIQYGPHRAEDAPTSVTVFRRASKGDDFEAARPPALMRQREQINQLARRGVSK